METDLWSILAGYLHKEEISPVEKERIDDWLKASEENRYIYKQFELFLLNNSFQHKSGQQEIDVAWAENIRRLHLRQKNKRRKIYRRWQYAAVFMLLCGIAVSLLYPSSISHEVPQTHPYEMILSGSSKAILTLASGEKISLHEKDGLTIHEESSIIQNEKNVLKYAASDSQIHQPAIFNRLEIPCGGEYKLILEDGTIVWLNSATELYFPVTFNDSVRRVYLKGEAYFQVRKDKSRPFIVRADDIDITVLGTEFNISTLANEGEIFTTLVKGSVKIGKKGIGTTALKPSEQAIYHKDKQTISVKVVNTLLYTSWKDGFYTFEQQNLEDIMNTMARWYNIQVVFSTETIRHLRFSGRLKRYEDINYFLSMIKLTNDVDFIIEGRKITITEK